MNSVLNPQQTFGISKTLTWDLFLFSLMCKLSSDNTVIIWHFKKFNLKFKNIPVTFKWVATK